MGSNLPKNRFFKMPKLHQRLKGLTHWNPQICREYIDFICKIALKKFFKDFAKLNNLRKKKNKSNFCLLSL